MQPLIYELRREHGAIIQMLCRLSAAGNEIRLGRPPDVAQIDSLLVRLTTGPDLFHHPKEEMLFEQICKHTGEVHPLIVRLRDDHRVLLEMGRQVRSRLTELGQHHDREPALFMATCHDYIHGQRWHIAQEETGLYRLAESVLSPQDWTTIENRIRERYPKQWVADRSENPSPPS